MSSSNMQLNQILKQLLSQCSLLGLSLDLYFLYFEVILFHHNFSQMADFHSCLQNIDANYNFMIPNILKQIKLALTRFSPHSLFFISQQTVVQFIKYLLFLQFLYQNQRRTMENSISFSEKTAKRNIKNNMAVNQIKPTDLEEHDEDKENLPIIRRNQRQRKLSQTDLQNFKQKIAFRSITIFSSCFSLLKLPQPLKNVSLLNLNELNFPVLSHSINELLLFSQMIIESNSERAAISKQFNLKLLLLQIASKYHSNAYHNFSHAFSVLLLVHQCYNRSAELRVGLSEQQWLYVMLAALAHDLNHPSTTNNFQIKINSQYAKQAQKQSVLQKMHLRTFWSILEQNEDANFLLKFTSIKSQQIRKIFTRMILATDVAQHFKGLQSLKTIKHQKLPLQGQTAKIVMEQIFHACDIGNPCLDFQSYINWGVLISYEFNQIVNREQLLGLQATQYMRFEGLNKYYQGQKGFCNGFVLPLWMQLDGMVPGLKQLCQNIQTNIEQLEKCALQQKQK